MTKSEDAPSTTQNATERDELSAAIETKKGAYRQPPAEHRIKKGEKRNPWGRAGKPKPEIEFLDGFVVMIVNGKKKKMTRRQALNEMLFREAMRGSISASKQLEQIEEKRRATKALAGDVEANSPEGDIILERLVERQVARRLKHRDNQ